MMELILQRTIELPDRTLGILVVNGSKFCYTLEDAVREKPNVPVSEWKIDKQTAIPSGSYKVVMDYSGRFKKEMLHVLNVPGFSGIRIHSGNLPGDTEGCILVGYEIENDAIKGGTSRMALMALEFLISSEVASGVMLHVKNIA